MNHSISSAADVVQQGGIIAYPTEAVFGLGCDPENNHAIKKLLQIKQRQADKGLILLASNYEQLLAYVDDVQLQQKVGHHKYLSILARWPDAITQLLPAKANISSLLCGKFDTIAVRVSNHPDVIALCKTLGKPIISTSANLSGQQAAITWQQVEQQLGDKVDYLIKGKTLGLTKPSVIINALTEEVIRP